MSQFELVVSSVPTLPPGPNRATQVREAIWRRRVCGQIAEWEIGLLLYEVGKEELWKSYADANGKPYSSFDAFVQEDVGFGIGKAFDIMRCARTYLVELAVPGESLRGVCWTHAAIMRPIVTRENVLDWLDFARVRSLATVTSAVRDAQRLLEASTDTSATLPEAAIISSSPASSEPVLDVEAVLSLVPPWAQLDPVKSPDVFESAPAPVPPATPVRSIAPPPPEAVKTVRRVGCLLEGDDLALYDAAILLAGRLSGSGSQAANLLAICTEFVAANSPPLTEIGLHRDVLLKRLGSWLGGELTFTPSPEA